MKKDSQNRREQLRVLISKITRIWRDIIARFIRQELRIKRETGLTTYFLLTERTGEAGRTATLEILVRIYWLLRNRTDSLVNAWIRITGAPLTGLSSVHRRTFASESIPRPS